MWTYLKTLLSSYWSELLISAALLIGCVVVYNLIYTRGYDAGTTKIQSMWDASKEAQRAEIEKLQEQYRVKEEEYRHANNKITQELSDARRQYEVDISSVAGAYELRLRQSQDRASVYQRQAQGGESEQRNLASHAAKLDGALTEGVRLVKELRGALEFRERQLQQLGQQILNDRKLLNQ